MTLQTEVKCAHPGCTDTVLVYCTPANAFQLSMLRFFCMAHNGGKFITFHEDIKEEERMIREVKIVTTRHTTVLSLDRPGPGGAHHAYTVVKSGSNGVLPEAGETFAMVNFQKGPVKEVGINGCHQEDLIAIVLDRLRSFQSGSHPCEENAKAIRGLEDAMLWLQSRTQRRVDAGVEGTSEGA